MMLCAAPRVKWLLLLTATVAFGGCGKVKQKQPTETAHTRAVAKRHKAACASSSAYGRLKDAIFDQAAARHTGDQGTLATLAEFSFVRMEDPVVEGWDPLLDKTRCAGRFILDVPPGAEKGLGGQRKLTADVTYTAQRAADGSGLVYALSGAGPIVASLAAFNLTGATYQPLPAVDSGSAGEEVAVVTSREKTPTPSPAAPAQPVEATPRTTAATPRAVHDDEAAPRSAAHDDHASRGAAPPVAHPMGSSSGEAIVRTFYTALGAGNGVLASAQVVPEKRSTRAFSADAISRFYGRLADPLQLTGVERIGEEAYRVRYRYADVHARCNGSAIVRLTERGDRHFIRSITAPNGC